MFNCQPAGYCYSQKELFE